MLLDDLLREEIAQRGKSEEKKVAAVLAKLKTKFIEFDYARRPDARSGRGRGVPQPSDFECLYKGTAFEIEVKSTKAVNTIPYKNFSQLGMLRRRKLAGAKIIVLIYIAKVKAWCCPDEDWLFEDYDPDTRASWNISGWPTFTHVSELILDKLRTA